MDPLSCAFQKAGVAAVRYHSHFISLFLLKMLSCILVYPSFPEYRRHSGNSNRSRDRDFGAALRRLAAAPEGLTPAQADRLREFALETEAQPPPSMSFIPMPILSRGKWICGHLAQRVFFHSGLSVGNVFILGRGAVLWGMEGRCPQGGGGAAQLVLQGLGPHQGARTARPTPLSMTRTRCASRVSQEYMLSEFKNRSRITDRIDSEEGRPPC